MQKAAEVTAGRAVPERERDLAHGQARARGIDRHPRLAAEPGREREALRPRRGREETLPRERLLGVEPAAQPDKRASGCLRHAEAAALALREPRDGEVGAVLDERRELPLEVGVAEKQRARGELALGERQRLALAAAREPDDACSRLLGDARLCRRASRRRRPRPRPPENARAQRAYGLPDPLLLVARGDEDREAQPPVVVVCAGTSGRTPSVAVDSTP